MTVPGESRYQRQLREKMSRMQGEDEIQEKTQLSPSLCIFWREYQCVHARGSLFQGRSSGAHSASLIPAPTWPTWKLSLLRIQ